jgi:hypothetical protein
VKGAVAASAPREHGAGQRASAGGGGPQRPAGVHGSMLSLGSAIGNRRLGQALHSGLRIGGARDASEREAEHASSWAGGGGTAAARPAPAPSAVPSVVHEVLRAPGEPLRPDVRALMEDRLGSGLGGVRVHTDPRAARSARAVGARAYTVGPRVVFGPGEYAPGTAPGRRLVAHELAHVIQQCGASRAPGPDADAGRDSAGPTAPVLGRAPVQLARAPLDVASIAADVASSPSTPPELYSWVQIRGNRSGEIGFGAKPPKDKTKGPDAAPVPTDPDLPIQAHFFPSDQRHHGQKALVVGGYHGNERPGIEVADALVAELSAPGGAPDLYFHTLVVPHLNPGGIADVNRCNRQRVDLNRNLPVPGVKNPGSPTCENTAKAPVQPENQALMDVIAAFQPHRILSLHAISNPAEAGIFADPVKDPAARDLACDMARLVTDPANRRGNRLSATRCVPGYPGASTGGTSLGSWAPTRSIPGQTVPTITLEAPGFRSLGKGARSTEAFMRPVRGFLADPDTLSARPDLDIVRDIQALALPQRRLFLTGRLPAADDLLRRVRERVEQRAADLNALRPPGLPTIKIVSHHRGFETSQTAGGTSTRGQAHIVFEKFTLTGAHASGWDTLPDAYYLNGNRKAGVDRKRWLAEPSSTRLDVILRYSAIPGASRHHWGTDVDFNSTTVKDWAAAAQAKTPTQEATEAGPLNALGTWLQENAAKAGFIQAYTPPPGRTGGHNEEAWHYSYAPIALPLREMYRADVRVPQDVVTPMLDFFNREAKAQKITLPADLPKALADVNVAQYVDTIGPGL